MEENVNLTWLQEKSIDLVPKKASEDARAKVLKIARNYAMCLMLISISS